MKKTIFLFFAAILCAMNASAWSYKSAANSWKASTSGFTTVTMKSGKSVSVVMLKNVGDGVNICQNDDGSGQCLYCKWTKTSGDIFRGTARWNNGLYSDETVVVPGGKVYITVGSGTQVQMTAGTNYTYTADVTFSTTGQSYTISGGTVSGATIKNENYMPSGGKPASLTMKNSYTSKTTGNVHIEFDLKTNKVIETAASEPDPEPEPTVTLYFVNHPEWTNLKAHVWDNNSTPYKDWNNSESMTNTGLNKDGYAVYSYTFPSKYTNIIFKGDGQQTQDNVAAYDVAKPYFCDDKWYASLAEIPALGAVVTYDYYVIGTVNSWTLKDASHGMTDDNADGVYEKVVTLAAGKNQMKINNGTWDKQAGYDQLDAKYEGVSRGTSGDDNNIIINIATGKDITVKFDKNANKITLDGLTKIEDYYTVVGVAELFGTAWDRANETNKMAKQGDGSYKLVKENVTLAAIGYDWKIAKNGEWWDDAATGVNPAAGKNNTLTITTAGRYNVTFTLAADLKSATVETELLEAAVVIPDCFISGNKNLTGKETEWQGNEFTMVYDEATETWSYTLAGLQPEKAYELKVVCGGTWYNYADLTSVPTGVTEGNDHSIAFKMAAAGNVVVTYNVEAGITLSGNFALPVTYDYYIAGTLAGGWSAKQQGMEKDGELYKATFTELNAGTYQFKITDGQFNTEEDKTHEHTTLAAEYKEVSYVDGNIQFVTEEAKNIIVIFDATANKITIEGLTIVTHTYTIAGDAALCGEAWNWALEANDMTNNGDGTYTWTKAGVEVNGELSFKVFVDHKFETAYPAENWVIKPENYEGNGVYDVTITFTESSKDVAVALTKQEVAPTEIDVTLSGMVATPTSRMGSYRFLFLEDEDGNQISIFNGTEGAYGDDFEVNAYLAAYGVTVVGTGDWNVVDGVETLTATLQVEDDNTTIYNVVATVGAATTITLECYNATYTITDPELNEVTFTGIADGKEFTIVVAPDGAGYYSDGEWDGTPILGTSVEFDDSDAEEYYLGGTYIDDASNTYEVAIFGTPAVVEPTPTPDYTRTVTAGKFGTICLPFGGTVEGAELFECVGQETGKVYIASVTTLAAGVPYIFLATGTELAVYSDGTTAATPGKHKGLVGTFTDDTEVAVGNYILKDNALCQAAATCYVNANRAYLVMSEVPAGAPQQMPGRRYIGMSTQGENAATGLDNIATSENAVKVINNGQLIIIRGNEKFNAQGQKL